MDKLYGSCLLLNTYLCVKEMAQKDEKITRNTLANFICNKTGLSLNTYELSTLKERLKVPLKTMITNKEIEIDYELSEKKQNRAVYTVITQDEEE